MRIFKAILKTNSIKDCPVVKADIKPAEAIFGKDVAILKGKTTWSKSIPMVHDTAKISHELKQAQHEVTLAMDTFFVTKMAFLHTISNRIVYRTAQ